MWTDNSSCSSPSSSDTRTWGNSSVLLGCVCLGLCGHVWPECHTSTLSFGKPNLPQDYIFPILPECWNTKVLSHFSRSISHFSGVASFRYQVISTETNVWTLSLSKSLWVVQVLLQQVRAVVGLRLATLQAGNTGQPLAFCTVGNRGEQEERHKDTRGQLAASLDRFRNGAILLSSLRLWFY